MVAVGLGVQVHHLHNQVSALSSRSPLHRGRADRAGVPVHQTGGLECRPGVPPTGRARRRKATVVLTSSGTGFVEAGGLAGLPRYRTYQLWGVIGGKTISLGLLGSHPGVVPFSVAGGAGHRLRHHR